MTEKELKKLSRAELLELLVYQTKKVEDLQDELDEANRRLANRRIMLRNAGSIAEASLEINEVFRAAQAAADQYLENVKRNAARQQ